jgi:Fe-S-cluster formation regulator IscX/YfhJ
MAEVVNVDSGVAYKYSSTDVSEIVRSVSRDSKRPVSDILLLKPSGEVASIDSSVDSDEQQQLFLFRRDSEDFGAKPVKRDWQSEFYSFFNITTYDNKFVFDVYDSFPEHYSRIPTIEAELFSLASAARQAYAQFMTSIEYIEHLTTLLRAKAEASVVLLKNFALYYEEVSATVEHFASDLKDFALAQDTEIQEIDHPRDSLNPLSIEARATDFEEFRRELSSRLTRVDEKCMTLQKKTLPSISQQLSNAMNCWRMRYDGFQEFCDNYRSCNLDQKEAKLIEPLEAMGEYATFREKLESIMLYQDPNSTEIAQSLLDEDKLTSLKLINFTELQGIISQLHDFEAVAKENEARIMELYETKAVKFCLDNTQILKYQVLAKVTKMRTELDKLKALTDMMAKSAKQKHDGREDEVQRRRLAYGEIGGVYIELCKTIVADSSIRQEFIRKYGDILPKNAYPDLTTPIFSRCHLRHLLKIEAPSEPVEGDSGCIVMQYEAELRKLEESSIRKLDLSAKTSLGLEQDLVIIVQALDKAKADNESLKEEIRSYAFELSSLRQNSGDSTSHKLQAEIKRLAEREESFRLAHMEEIKQLREDNKRLRTQLTGALG